MIISAIAAMGKNRVIGVNNTLPWHLPLEFKHFQKKTLGHTIITGRKNFESIGHPLPDRHTIIVTRNLHYQQDACDVAHDFESALLKANIRKEQEVFVTGGADIYQLSLPYLHRFYRTIVDFSQPGDVYFPPYDDYNWKVKEHFLMPVQEKNSLAWTYELLEKKPEKFMNSSIA